MRQKKQQNLLLKQQTFLKILLKLFHHVNIKSWMRIRNIIKGFEVSEDFMAVCFAENFLQDAFEHLQFMWVVGQSEFTVRDELLDSNFRFNQSTQTNSPGLAACEDRVIQSDQVRLASHVEHRCSDISLVLAL